MKYHIRNTVTTYANPGSRHYTTEFEVDVPHEDMAMELARMEADKTCARLGRPATVNTEVKKVDVYYSWDVTVGAD